MYIYAFLFEAFPRFCRHKLLPDLITICLPRASCHEHERTPWVRWWVLFVQTLTITTMNPLMNVRAVSYERLLPSSWTDLMFTLPFSVFRIVS